MSNTQPSDETDTSLMSVRPRLRTVGRGKGGGIAREEIRELAITDIGERESREVTTRFSNQNMDSTSSLVTPSPLRPPLTAGQPTATASSTCYTSGHTLSRPDSLDIASCPGPVQQLLQQQLLHRQQLEQPQMSLTERDRQIAMVEEELRLARRMMELERKEQEVKDMARQLEEQLRNGGDGMYLVDVPRVDNDEGETCMNGTSGSSEVMSEDDRRREMFKQMEKARKEELERLSKAKSGQDQVLRTKYNNFEPFQPHNELTKQKIREMLDRKKREMNLRNGTNSSAGSSLKDTFLNKVEVPRRVCEVFDNDEETENNGLSSDIVEDKPSLNFTSSNAHVNKTDIDLKSVLGEDIPDQKMLWERIQMEKREEFERVSGLRHSDVVKEQQEILKKIQEQNELRRKEEDLTLKLVAELTLCDQRQQQQQILRQRVTEAVGDPPPVVSTRGAAPIPVSSKEDWTVVGERARERIASLKIAAELDKQRKERVEADDCRREMLEKEEEERRRQLRKWEENRKVRVVKSVDSFETVGQDKSNGQNFRDILVNGKSKELNQRGESSKDEGRRELGARRKSEGVSQLEVERRKSNDELKQRIVAQERELRAKTEKEALDREWNLATRRKEKTGELLAGQERYGKGEKKKKQKLKNLK